MSPSEKRGLRVSWYGLHIRWPLTNDRFGLPYFLASNDNGTRLVNRPGYCVSTVSVSAADYSARVQK